MKFTSIKSELLDPSYGEQGIVHPDPDVVAINASIVSVKHDKWRLCVGETRIGEAMGYALMRIDHNGKLDTTFGKGGLTTGTFKEGFNSTAGGIHLHGEHIIITGLYHDPSTNLHFPALARFTANGQLDTRFGSHGHKVIELPPAPPKSSTNPTTKPAAAPTLTSISSADGVFVTYQYPWSLSVLMKFNFDGDYDTSFNKVGYKFLTPPLCSESSGRVCLITGRKIYVCGFTTINGDSGPYILCLKDTGLEDGEFCANGYLLSELASGLYFHDLDTLNDEGSIVCIASEGLQKGYLTAFTRSGSKIPGFGGATDFGGEGGQWTSGYVNRSLEKIITTGSTLGGEEADVVVGRFNLDGTPDTAFGENRGWGRIALGDSVEVAWSSSAEVNGKTIICGIDFESGRARLGFLLRCNTDS